MIVDRRRLVAGLGIGGGALLSGCDKIAATPVMRGFFAGTEGLAHDFARAAAPPNALAPEFGRADLSPIFRSNGTSRPGGDDYAALAASNFTDWRLTIDGLVARPLSLSLADLVARPSRTQITRHDCVEGWSAIGQWTGTPLRQLLAEARLLPAARYAVFHCYDAYPGGNYYESLGLMDAVHPQTILAWALNGHRLPIANGAPLRLRVERQLGYKHAKYLRRIELVASLKPFGLGKGGYWEDSTDYAWYAGI